MGCKWRGVEFIAHLSILSVDFLPESGSEGAWLSRMEGRSEKVRAFDPLGKFYTLISKGVTLPLPLFVRLVRWYL